VYESELKYIKFQFHDDMKPFLIEFANQFVNYNIENILQFKSKYTLSFYEYFKLQTQFKKEPMITEVISVEELRDWLDLNANKQNKLKKDKYTAIKDLRVYILDKVSNDLKKFSDVYMTFDMIKTYRKVTHIKFNFTKNLDKIKRQLHFFDENDLKGEYDKFIGLKYKNRDGDVVIIKQILEVLKDVDYIKALVFNEFAQANQETKILKSALLKLKR